MKSEFKNLCDTLIKNKNFMIELHKHPVVLSYYTYMTPELCNSLKLAIKIYRFNETDTMCVIHDKTYGVGCEKFGIVSKDSPILKFNKLFEFLPTMFLVDLVLLSKEDIKNLNYNMIINPELKPFGLKLFDEFILKFELYNLNFLECRSRVIDILIEYSKKIVEKYGPHVEYRLINLDETTYDIDNNFIYNTDCELCRTYIIASTLNDILLKLIECCKQKVENKIILKDSSYKDSNNVKDYCRVIEGIAISFIYNIDEFNQAKISNCEFS